MSTWLMLLLTTSMKFFSFTIARKSPMFWKEDFCAFEQRYLSDHLWRDVHNNLLLQTPAAQRRGDQHFVNMT